MSKNISVSEKVHKKLEDKKQKMGAKSFNEVINILIERDKDD